MKPMHTDIWEALLYRIEETVHATEGMEGTNKALNRDTPFSISAPQRPLVDVSIEILQVYRSFPGKPQIPTSPTCLFIVTELN